MNNTTTTTTTTTTTMTTTTSNSVRKDMPKILAAIRKASRFNAYQFDMNSQLVELGLRRRLPADCWIGVACLPLVAVKALIIRREAVHEALFGIGSGTTGSGRTIFGAIDTAEAYSLGWKREEYTDSKNQFALAHNQGVWPTDTWVVVSMEKDPRLSEFATDRGEFGAVQWTVFAPQSEGTALQESKIVWCQASDAQMRAAEID